MIYIDNYPLANIDSFKEGLAEVNSIVDAQRATWIKPRKQTSQAVLIKFAGEEIPEYLRITAEYTPTKVYPYNEKPLMCRNCQKYGHGKNCARRSDPLVVGPRDHTMCRYATKKVHTQSVRIVLSRMEP